MDSNLSRFAGVSEARARRRNPERSEGPPLYQITGNMVGPNGFELEPFCWREEMQVVILRQPGARLSQIRFLRDKSINDDRYGSKVLSH